MRIIEVNTDVYAAIWAAHMPGEECENDILSRVLNVVTNGDDSKATQSNGVRVGIQESKGFFPAGFKAYRVYKGKRYDAVARDGYWELLNTGKRYKSLNQTNKSFVAGTENAWLSWRSAETKGLLSRYFQN